MSIHTEFERALYRAIAVDVRRHKPDVKLREAWVCGFHRHWEFHYRDFYWHGSASGAYQARVKGWSAWLAAQTGNRG